MLDKHLEKGGKPDEQAAIWDHDRDMGITGRLLNDQERQAKIKWVQIHVRADPQGGPRTQRQVWAQRTRRVLYVTATHAYVYIVALAQVKRCTTTAF
jgi:hypothetical protein